MAPAPEQEQENEQENDARRAQVGIAPALAALRACLASEHHQPDLRGIGNATRLHLLFHLELCALVRSGPEYGGRQRLHRLMTVAALATAHGALLLATPTALRDALAAVRTALHRDGVWETDTPLWWEPLPALAPLEVLWRQLAGSRRPLLALPDPDRLDAAFSGLQAPRALLHPALLAPDLTARLHGELEAAWAAERLPLQRAGVGVVGAVTAQRGDEVCYVDGTEPALVAAVPALAVLVQWGLHNLAARLGSVLPGKTAYAPQKAMLARYPAPSHGYDAHLDNPSGAADNGRALTLVLYLNGPEAPCRGGELEVWAPAVSTAVPPALTLPAGAGAAALFDARTIPHRVRPLAPGPARWALTFWFNDAPQAPQPLPPPRPVQRDVLLATTAPPLPPRTVLFHTLDASDPAGQIEVFTVPQAQPLVGLVATVYHGGSALDAWCAHHLALGFDHLLLVFDHLQDAAEAADAARLRAAHPASRLTIWSGEDLVAADWSTVSDEPAMQALRSLAAGGGSSHAVAARQALNASAALAAARGDMLGGAPLDWLLHLDADELVYLEGAGRGGATLHDHFAAASAAGLSLLRYLNHEQLLPRQPGASVCFKRNPRLAAARLGIVGWEKLVAHLTMGQKAPRPYFNSYHNGKSAVAVNAAVAAAGVHSWTLHATSPASHRVLAGPSVLHFHCPSAQRFREKYQSKAAAPRGTKKEPFSASPMETAALRLIRQLEAEGASSQTVAERLDTLYASLTSFSEHDIELLTEAGLILQPNLDLSL